MADEFQVVVRAKRRQKFSKLKKHLQETQQIGQTTTRDDKEENDGFSSSSLKSLINILEDCSKEIALTNFYKTFKDILLVKLHRGSKCEQHPPSFLRTVQNDSPKPPSAEDSTADLSRATSSESNEETDLEIPRIQDSDKIASSGLESSESSSSFPFSCAEAVSSQLDHLDGFVENADHCKELAGLELVIYGIGNYADCLIARYQFALMLALRKTLKLPQARLLVFDPRLSNIEKSVINELGLALISHNEEGKRPGSDKHWTLFFMPHCGKALCNNLLWANWSPHQLANIIIIGNSFSSIVERSPERLLKEYYYYIWKIYSITDETSLPNSFKHADVFNDSSIHCFRSVELSQLPEDFWREHTEPVYDSSDLEIIVNK